MGTAVMMVSSLGRMRKQRPVGIQAAAVGSLKWQRGSVVGLMPESIDDSSWGVPAPIPGRRRRNQGGEMGSNDL